MRGFPRYVVLQSDRLKKCFRYVHEEGEAQGRVECKGEQVISPYSKFELVPAKNKHLASEGLFNILCCYNNKYWRRDQNSEFVTATADEPDEDKLSSSCTLFRPIYPHRAYTLQLDFCGFSQKVYLCVDPESSPYLACFPPGVEDDHNGLTDADTTYRFIDWESLVILPKKVIFKGDNDLYLSPPDDNNDRPYLEFRTKDSADETLPNEIFYGLDGSVRIKSCYNRKFWKRKANWILADSTDENLAHSDTWFWLVKGKGDNEVALLNRANNKYCKSRTAQGNTNCLDASASTMVAQAILKVEDAVLTRNIYDIKFRLKDAKIYREQPVVKATKKVSNTLDVPLVTRISQTITTETTKIWKSHVSLKLGVSTKLTTGIPAVVGDEVQISAEFEGGYEWGEEMKDSKAIESSEDITVPPNSTVLVHVMATKGKCDVPFSYKQRDTFTNGHQEIIQSDDGIYTGIESYSFTTEVVKAP